MLTHQICTVYMDIVIYIIYIHWLWRTLSIETSVYYYVNPSNLRSLWILFIDCAGPENRNCREISKYITFCMFITKLWAVFGIFWYILYIYIYIYIKESKEKEEFVKDPEHRICAVYGYFCYNHIYINLYIYWLWRTWEPKLFSIFNTWICAVIDTNFVYTI